MVSMNAGKHVLDLPTEIVYQVLSYLDPYELAAFAQSCKAASVAASSSNRVLWRYAFLKLFDDPVQARAEMLPAARPADEDAVFDWYARLRERCVALKTITTKNEEYRRTHMRPSTDVIVNIIETARCSDDTTPSSRKPQRDHKAFSSHSITTLERAFQSSPDAEKLIHSFGSDVSLTSRLTGTERLAQILNLDRPFTRSMVPDAEPISESASRLHVYYGVTQHERLDPRCQMGARRIIYDFQHADERNDYGPFRCDGSGEIDWLILEAVTSTMGYAFEHLVAGQIKIPQSLRYAIPRQVSIDPACPEDWAGVNRRWLGTYSFVDYTMLNHLNQALRRGYRPTMDHIDEAHGDVLALELKLDHELAGDPRLKTNLPVCDDLPMLYFRGGSHPLIRQRTHIEVRGTASLVPGGRCVRWRFIIRYGGMDQWQLEGVQPGGIRSGGIFGRWTHCDHDEDGPIGPFCYYPEDLCEYTR